MRKLAFTACALLLGCSTALPIKPDRVSVRGRAIEARPPPQAVYVVPFEAPPALGPVEAVVKALGYRGRGPESGPRLHVGVRPLAVRPLQSTLQAGRPRHGHGKPSGDSFEVASTGARRGGKRKPKKVPGMLLTAEVRLPNGTVTWIGELWVPKGAYERCTLHWLKTLVADLGTQTERFEAARCPAVRGRDAR